MCVQKRDGGDAVTQPSCQLTGDLLKTKFDKLTAVICLLVESSLPTSQANALKALIKKEINSTRNDLGEQILILEG